MDDFSNHEVLDRAYMALSFFDDYVASHDVLKALSEDHPLSKAVSSALDALSDVYQEAGAL